MATATFDPDCTRCPRLAAFLGEVHERYPDYHARPVPPFGVERPRLLIVGLAPGLHGANRTARPFTGDYAGVLLYATLYELGLGSSPTSTTADDALRLHDTRITNAVKCVPPANKPLPDEIRRCNAYLQAELTELASARAVLALGRIAHDSILRASGLKPRAMAFAHGAEHRLDERRWLVDSYHCSRYNTNTRRLTPQMFRAVMTRAAELAGIER